MASFGRLAFQLACQISPIVLTGGVAGLIPGGMIPIISLSQAIDFAGLLGGGGPTSLDDFLLQFFPLQGATLIDQKIGMYPFANQQTAANAVIRDPLTISMRMNVNALPGVSGYATKALTISALQATLQQHNNSGGTYTIVTPSFIYTNCVMLSMRDISRNDIKQPQNAWQLDFIQPLVTLQQALEAQAQMNSTMGQISSGVPTSGDTSGLSPTIGSPPSLATPFVAPAASGLPGAGVAGGLPYNVGPSGQQFATSLVGQGGIGSQ